MTIIEIIQKEICSYSDAAEDWQVGIQDPASPLAEGMGFFHNQLTSLLAIVGLFVLLILWRTISNSLKGQKLDSSAGVFTHSSFLEIAWTLIPAFLLLIMAIPSFTLLYSIDEYVDFSLTMKIVGHQWYWSYEYSDYTSEDFSFCFDSYMIPASDLPKGTLRLLEVDNRVVLPIEAHVRTLITAADVLHSWAMPSFGVKSDATPGRLSQSSVFIKREGNFFGQCSEICGVNHGFMPIVVRSVIEQFFVDWLAAQTVMPICIPSSPDDKDPSIGLHDDLTDEEIEKICTIETIVFIVILGLVYCLYIGK